MITIIQAKFDKHAKKTISIAINDDKINYIGNGEIMLDKGVVYVDKDTEDKLCEMLGYDLIEQYKLHKEFQKRSETVKRLYEVKDCDSDNDIDDEHNPNETPSEPTKISLWETFYNRFKNFI